jgi:pimeloyl-ACP methyl ester carboxylesterase
VIETLDSLAVKDFILIGHSMGVRTAIAVAHLVPQRIKNLIAVDLGISSEWGGGIGHPLAKFLEALPTTFKSRSALKEYLLRECPDPAIAQYLTAVSKKISDDPETWNFPFDHEALIKTIDEANDSPLGEWVLNSVAQGVQMNFLRGENSKVWLKADYEAQKSKYERPGLHFEEWPNCGHGLPFEQRAKFVEYLKREAT